MLVSLHPWADFDEWYEHCQQLWDAGHFLKFHIVRSKLSDNVVEFLKKKEIVGTYSTALCGDQRGGVKSRGPKSNQMYPHVTCTGRIFLFGPDGYRYICVTRLGKGSRMGKFEHISDEDGPNWLSADCYGFGLCVGCDNNIEGTVTYYG